MDHGSIEYSRTITNELEHLRRSTAVEYRFAVSHPAEREARQEIIDAFAGRLRELHLDCGKPSFTRLDRRSRQTGNRLAPASISEALNGKRMQSLDFVTSLVRAMLSFHMPPGQAVPRNDDRVEAWIRAWKESQKALDALPQRVRTRGRRPASKHVVSEPEPPPADAAPAAQAARALVPVEGEDKASDDGEPHRPEKPRGAFRTAPSSRRQRGLLDDLLSAHDEDGRRWGDGRYGCYAFYDLDGEPLWLGSTTESLRSRVRRHLVGQRSDAVARGVLDAGEVAEVELWPMWEQEGEPREQARQAAEALEGILYPRLAARSRFGELLSQRPSAPDRPVEIPPSLRSSLLLPEERQDLSQSPDVRIARMARSIAKLTDWIVDVDPGGAAPEVHRALALKALRLSDQANRSRGIQGET